MRSGTLPLHIETGRFQGLEIENRICEFCDSSTPETEVHFLFYCKAYDQHRKILYDKVTEKITNFRSLPDPDKLKLLFKNCCRQLGRYVEVAYNIRKSILYHHC